MDENWGCFPILGNLQRWDITNKIRNPGWVLYSTWVLQVGRLQDVTGKKPNNWAIGIIIHVQFDWIHCVRQLGGTCWGWIRLTTYWPWDWPWMFVDVPWIDDLFWAICALPFWAFDGSMNDTTSKNISVWLHAKTAIHCAYWNIYIYMYIYIYIHIIIYIHIYIYISLFIYIYIYWTIIDMVTLHYPVI